MWRVTLAVALVALAIGGTAGFWLAVNQDSSRRAATGTGVIADNQPAASQPATRRPEHPAIQETDGFHPIDRMVAKAEEKYGASTATALVYGQATDLWEKERNATYQKLMKTLPPGLQEQLQATERAWMEFRDQQRELLTMVRAEYDPDGTMWLSERNLAIMIVTKRRAEDLGVLDWSIHFCP